MRTNITKLAIYLVAFLTILDSSMMWMLIQGTILTSNVVYVLQCIFIILASFSFRNKNIRVSCVRYTLIGMVYMAMYLLFTRINVLGFMRSILVPLLLCFVFCYQMVNNRKLSLFISAYGNILLVIAVISLIGWGLGSMLNVLPGRMTISYEWADQVLPSYTYGFLYFENPVQSSGTLIRNTGIYAEAPGYSAYLLFAIGLELFAYRRLRKGRFAVLCAALISTFSTKGQIILIAIIILKFVLQVKARNNIILCIKILASGLIVVMGMVLAIGILTEKSTTSSYIIRMDDLLSLFKAWLSSPLYGVGYGNIEAVQRFQMVTRSNDGLSMGLAVLLAYGGLWLLILYVGAFICAITRPILKPYRRSIVLFSTLVMMNLFISNQCFIPVTLLMVACGYATLALPKRQSPLKQGLQQQTATTA